MLHQQTPLSSPASPRHSARGEEVFSVLTNIVMAALVAAIHFPEADEVLHRLWKMDHRDEPGDDDFLLESNRSTAWFPLTSHRACHARCSPGMTVEHYGAQRAPAITTRTREHGG